jgi:hypothetical protein
MAATNKCLARNNKSRGRGKATKKRIMPNDGFPQMKKLLMTTATLLALGSLPSLAAPTVDENLIGSWCVANEDGGKNETRYWSKTDGQDCGDGILIIRPTSYRGWEHSCRFTAVKTRFDPNIVAATKMMGVKVSRIEARCEGEGCTWREQLTAYVSKGTLVIKNTRHYRERCNGEG